MSQFLRKISDNQNQEVIDFRSAVRLPDGGSTCDLFRTRWQRREVFVKRLKKEYRTNPLYLDALDKEFEIGVSLKHPSLPDYREFHGDYILIDYIDGVTLGDMIKNQDPWLENEKNIIRMLRELVEVTDYLHRHNVTHCDIKPDNIMITANNKNLVLIDLDKCYTDSFNDTSGDPSKYGLSANQQGRISMDFHGIARVVEKLNEELPHFRFRRYKIFLRECLNKDCNSDRLLKILDYEPSGKNLKPVLLLMAICIIGVGGFLFLYFLTPSINKDELQTAVEMPREVPVENPVDTIADIPVKEEKTKRVETKKIEVAKEQDEKTQDELIKEAKARAAVLDKKIEPYFAKLNASLDNLERMKSNTELTRQQQLDSISLHSNMEVEYCREAFEILKETFPGLTEREVWRVIAYSKVYTGYKRRAEPFLRNYFN
ncbi:MAG: protein kinase [Muribaculaceae bacterium]|nr:protein kinase [Muribaculaceae bacterium]